MPLSPDLMLDNLDIQQRPQKIDNTFRLRGSNQFKMLLGLPGEHRQQTLPKFNVRLDLILQDGSRRSGWLQVTDSIAVRCLIVNLVRPCGDFSGGTEVERIWRSSFRTAVSEDLIPRRTHIPT